MFLNVNMLAVVDTVRPKDLGIIIVKQLTPTYHIDLFIAIEPSSVPI